jgi:recombination associated protein RdgC
MFFKNAYILAFTHPFTATNEELSLALQALTFTPLGSTELRHFGWTNSLGKGSNLTTESNGNILICARSEEKILPAQYMKECIDEQVEAIESEQGRGVTKKEREQIKEDVIFNMLPRAFTRTVDTHAYINAEQNTIVVNSSSRGKAEDLLALLRKTLGTLPVTNITPDTDPDEVMTDWVFGLHCLEESPHELGTLFSFGEEAHFNSIGDQSASAVVKNQDLCSEEVKAHLDADKYVTKIALEYDESMSFMLSDDLSIKRIKFFDVITEQNDDIDCDDINGKLTADFTLMAGELNRMIDDLFAEFSVDARSYQEAK